MGNNSKFQFILFIFEIIFQAQGLYEGSFELDRNLSDKVPSGIVPVTARSLADCGNKCTSSYGCTGFHYSLIDHRCFLETSSISHLTLVANAFTEHFVLSIGAPSSIVSHTTSNMSSSVHTITSSQQSPSKTALSTASTSVTSTNAGIAIVSNSACPSRFEQDVIVEGISGLTYRFKIVDINETKNGAKIKCATYGMQLFKVDNNIKVHDLSKFLNGCKVYKGLQFWTDASMAMNSWKNSDGSPVPKSAWCHGIPGSKVDQTCAQLSTACGFKLTDCSCQSNILKIGLICE